jgi:hypothetical protein
MAASSALIDLHASYGERQRLSRPPPEKGAGGDSVAVAAVPNAGEKLKMLVLLPQGGGRFDVRGASNRNGYGDCGHERHEDGCGSE